MTLDINIGDSADALAQNQLTDALDGTYWSDGWDASTGSADYEVDIASGEGAYEGSTIETGSTETVDFEDDVDPDDPRKAVIFVDEDENVEHKVGDAVAADPEDETRFRTWDPAPPADVDGVVVAEVWLGADASEVVSEDIRDRRVANQAVDNVSGFSLVASSHDDKTSDRADGQEYTNDTGHPLIVDVIVESTADDSEDFVRSVVDDKTVREHNFTMENQDTVTLSVTVPDGSDYAFFWGPDRELDSWYEQELRIE